MSRETRTLLGLQRRTVHSKTLPVAQPRSSAARSEHATWIAADAVEAAVYAWASQRWVQAVLTVVASHGSSVILKRIVRRVRPADPSLIAHVAVPGRWSSPSRHAASSCDAASTTTAIVYGRPGTPRTAVVAAAMAWSRLARGVHHPSDVLSGVASGRTEAARAPISRTTGGR